MPPLAPSRAKSLPLTPRSSSPRQTQADRSPRRRGHRAQPAPAGRPFVQPPRRRAAGAQHGGQHRRVRLGARLAVAAGGKARLAQDPLRRLVVPRREQPALCLRENVDLPRHQPRDRPGLHLFHYQFIGRTLTDPRSVRGIHRGRYALYPLPYCRFGVRRPGAVRPQCRLQLPQPVTRPLRIALFSGNFNYLREGANQSLNRLVGYLEGAGHRVRVYSPVTDTPAFPPQGTLIPVPSIPLPIRSEFRLALGIPPAVRRDIERFAPDLIHVSVPDILNTRAETWAEQRNVPIVASLHTRFETYPAYYPGLRW